MFRLNNFKAKKKQNNISILIIYISTNISFICSNDIGLRISIILIIFKTKKEVY